MSKSTLLFILLLFSCGPLAYAESYQVVFETIDCDGSTGFATVGVETIYKIIEADCSHPDNPDEKLKQLLVNDYRGSYNTYTLSHEEAGEMMQEVKAYMRARRELLERSEAIIVKP